MLDVHPPHHAAHTWRDFFIHIATIVVGLFIAVALEQAVEALHHHHQRHQLEEDLRSEAESNRKLIANDLRMRDLEPWFESVVAAVSSAHAEAGRMRVVLAPAPCLPGSTGTAAIRYFAPSAAVWTTAKESDLVPLLPVEEARMYARLDHNYDLLAGQRDEVHRGCDMVTAMQRRFSTPLDKGAQRQWTLTPEQAERLAEAAAATRVSIQGLCFRLRWTDVYEKGVLEGVTHADVQMMYVNQERFQDGETPPASEAAQP